MKRNDLSEEDKLNIAAKKLKEIVKKQITEKNDSKVEAY